MKNQTRYLSTNKPGQHRASRRNGRRQGYVAILVALSWLALCGVAALSFDLSRMYTRKAEAQKTADASSLVGAAAYGGAFDADQNNPGSDAQHLALALQKAREYAVLNGYDTTKGATVNGAPGTGEESGLYRVTVSRPEPVFFARVFFGPTMTIFGTAAAEFTQPQAVPLRNYGVANGPVTLSVFGPDAYKYNGDPYSTKYASSGGPTNSDAAKRIPNPDYKPGGYDFNVTPTGGSASYISQNTDSNGKAILQIEIYDPGTDNGANGPNAKQNVAVDEIRPGWNGTVKTTTKYTLKYGDTVVDSKSFGPGNQGPDMAWDKTFAVDLSNPTYQTGKQFTLNVTSTDGSSENGFNLRAGPPHADTMTDAEWTAANGNKVSMSGKDSLPMNFNNNGNITIDLGEVQPLKRGGKVFIDKFDLDVRQSQNVKNTITYYDNGTAKTPQGNVPDSANGVWTPTDIYTLPDNYQGGRWTAVYTAGSNDTSVWRMRYTGPGNFRLVR